jgi:nucleoid DNA-binding protein
LTEGNRIEFRGFGIFNVRPRKTGIGRNPPHDLARHLAGRDRSSHRYDQLCR